MWVLLVILEETQSDEAPMRGTLGGANEGDCWLLWREIKVAT
jgi:hypothetical protein